MNKNYSIKIISNESYKSAYNKYGLPFKADILYGYKLDRNKIKEFVKDADIIMLASESAMPFDKELIDAAKNVKLISIETTDFSWIDINYAAERGITVANSPHVCTEAVAEQTIAFMLNFSKKIHSAYRDLYLHHKNMTLSLGTELKDKTLGIIGLGDIGSRVAEIAKCLGMQVFAYNRTRKNIPGIQETELNKLLGTSDFTTLHLAANKQTNEFINANNIDKIKKGAFVINLADKSLVNHDALLNALKRNIIAGYAEEVWDIKETEEHEIYKHENCMAFHGFGWYTHESLDRTYNQWLKNITEYLKGNIINKVN